jgi:hypothetical protein
VAVVGRRWHMEVGQSNVADLPEEAEERLRTMGCSLTEGAGIAVVYRMAVVLAAVNHTGLIEVSGCQCKLTVGTRGRILTIIWPLRYRAVAVMLWLSRRRGRYTAVRVPSVLPGRRGAMVLLAFLARWRGIRRCTVLARRGRVGRRAMLARRPAVWCRIVLTGRGRVIRGRRSIWWLV